MTHVRSTRQSNRLIISRLRPQGTYLGTFLFHGQRMWALFHSDASKGETIKGTPSVAVYAETLSKLADTLQNIRRAEKARQFQANRLMISPKVRGNGKRKSTGR